MSTTNTELDEWKEKLDEARRGEIKTYFSNKEKFDTSESTVFYHYTNADNLGSIRKDKVLKKSDGPRGTNFGKGVAYLTKMPPETGRKNLVENNWDGGMHNIMNKKNRVGAFVEVWIPKSQIGKTVNKVPRKKCKKRDIWVHTGDIDFRKYAVSVCSVNLGEEEHKMLTQKELDIVKQNEHYIQNQLSKPKEERPGNYDKFVNFLYATSIDDLQ